MFMRCLLVAIVFLGISPQAQVQPRLPVHVESLEYPPMARGARIEGDVVAQVRVDAAGRVVIEDGGRLDENGLLTNPILTRAAFDNLKKWQFQPGPEATLKITYHFRLAGPPAPRPDCFPSRAAFDFPDSVTVTAPPPEQDH